MAELLSVDRDQWRAEMSAIGQYLDEFGERLPAGLKAEHAATLARLG
jgi:phosphoenolpyruvate carboxykinase (GTP)